MNKKLNFVVNIIAKNVKKFLIVINRLSLCTAKSIIRVI